MKSRRLVFCIVLFQIAFQLGYGQDVSLVMGNFKILSAEKTIHLEFTYDSLQVGKYKNETDYVQKKVTEMNKKYPGKGDAWANEWIAQRREKFEPGFISAFKESFGRDTSSQSKYTLIFNTYYIEQGFSTSGILVHKNPEIRGVLILVSSDDKTKIIAEARVTRATGKAGPHFETGDHVDAAYAQAGDGLGTFLLNN